jgi:predicted CoA-binding protein
MSEYKKTLVLGASSKPGRASGEAVTKLRKAGHEVVAIGAQEGQIGDVLVRTDQPIFIDELHTISLYLNPTHQTAFYDYLLTLKPKRIIFNPGTENEEFEKLAQQNQINTERACTLVLLSLNTY